MAAYLHERTVALAAVREAARLCRTVQAGIDPGVLAKDDRSPVTIADFGSQALVCRHLREAFPADPVIAEEDAAALRQTAHAGVRTQVVEQVQAWRAAATPGEVLGWIDHGNAAAYSDRFWTLDPIDGTKGFLRGEQYAVALALIVEGRVVVAALACPNLHGGSVYLAVRGEGTQRLGMTGAASETLRVSPQTDPAQARFCESVEAAHSAHGWAADVARRLALTAAPVRLDSQAKYGVLAEGAAELYLRLPTRPGYVEKIWDHAAGTLVVEEAGGRVTDVMGRPLDFSRGAGLTHNRGVVAGNPTFHAAALEVLAAIADH